jgi:hypothetical protein
MSKPTMPRFLYKYRTFTDEFRSLEKILTGNLWHINSRTDFDDVEDCLVPRIELANVHVSEQLPREKIQEDIDRVGIFCLSELDDHPMLWKEYAADGLGVVLCLDMTKAEPIEPWREHGPFEVRYSDKPRRVWDTRAEGRALWRQTEDVLLRKRTKWAYQKERRFILHRSAENTIGDYPMPTDALYAVILGRRLGEAECREIVRWIKAGPWNPKPKLFCRDAVQSGYLF